MAAVNLKSIAATAGVSVATASRVLSGSDYPVKEELRARVLKVAEELDYVPNANAQGLLRGRSQTVGVLVGDVADPLFSGMVGGIHDVADKAGYMATVVNTYRQPGNELATMRRLRAQRVDIMIIAASGLVDPMHTEGMEKSLAAFIKSGNSAVLIGHHEMSDELKASRVLFDNRFAARQMAEHLHGLGHRDVALVTGDQRLLSTHDRVEGFRDVFGDRLVPREAPATRDGGYKLAGEFLRDASHVTAIASTADQMAFGVLARLREEGISVPGEMSVTGFNGIEFAQDTVPGLTSVQLPLAEMGRRAMEFGLKGLERGPQEVRVEAKLSIRESAAPVLAHQPACHQYLGATRGPNR